MEDKLPENDIKVLTFSKEYGAVIGTINSDFSYRWLAVYTDYESGEPCLWENCTITHWMPLSEPPKGGMRCQS